MFVDYFLWIRTFAALHPSSGPRSPPPPSAECEEWLRVNYINQQNTPLNEKRCTETQSEMDVRGQEVSSQRVRTQVTHLYLSDSEVGLM